MRLAAQILEKKVPKYLATSGGLGKKTNVTVHVDLYLISLSFQVTEYRRSDFANDLEMDLKLIYFRLVTFPHRRGPPPQPPRQAGHEMLGVLRGHPSSQLIMLSGLGFVMENKMETTIV